MIYFRAKNKNEKGEKKTYKQKKQIKNIAIETF